MNFRNQVWRGRRTACCLLLCLARVGRTHLAFQTGTIYTPPSPQWWVPLPISPPTLSAGSLPGQGGEETPVLCGAGSGCPQGGHFLLLTHEAVNPSSSQHWLSLSFSSAPGAQMWLLELSCTFLLSLSCPGTIRRGPALWVLPACSSSLKALLPLFLCCWSLSPAHSTFHPQVTYSKSKLL